MEWIALYRGVNMNEKIKTVPFMWDIPENTLEMHIACKIYEDGEIRTVECTIKDMGEIHKGMIAGAEYDEANAVYELVEGCEDAVGGQNGTINP